MSRYLSGIGLEVPGPVDSIEPAPAGERAPATPRPRKERPPMTEAEKVFWRNYRQSSERMRMSIRKDREMSKELTTIMAKYRTDTGAILGKLRELAEDEAGEANGFVPKYTAAKRTELRDGIRRLLRGADREAQAALDAWMAAVRGATTKARVEAGEGLATQERIAAMMESDYLARTSSADDLVDQADLALKRGDPVGASIRLRAAKLAANGRPVKGVTAVEQAVEAALDQHVPERRDAAGREHEAKLALIDATTERYRTRSEAMALIGDAPAAATASIGAKLTAREAAR